MLSNCLLIFVICVCLIRYTLSHPQCLDGKPPFKPTVTLRFCTEYKSLGCCSIDQEQETQKEYDRISAYISSTSCKTHIKTILCQRCSPYAAHLYSFEERGVPLDFPGLCGGYCRSVYDVCGVEALRKLSTDRSFIVALQRGRSRFCKHVELSDKDYCYPLLKTNPVLTEQFSRSAADTPGCMCLQKVATNHGLVTFIVTNPVDDKILYIGEQRGMVYVYNAGVKRRRPFLDLSRSVLLSKSVGDERGLLGMVFHPNFSRDRRFFLYYVLKTDYGQIVRISQWTARNRKVAKVNSEVVLMDIRQPFSNHNGGQLLFGDDGYLYIFTGDGGSAGDPYNFSQNKKSFLGKALRIDVRKKNGYTIPVDNPFVDNTDQALAEIFAYGLRNPWGCSVDRGDTRTGKGKGRIFCADVGQNRYEEIDIIVKGGNYGWGSREGFECYSIPSRREDSCGKIGPEVLPIHAYQHSYGKSVTGGYIYRGCDYPELNGVYIYGDFTSGRVFKLSERRGRWRNEEIKMCSTSTCTGNWVSEYGKGISTFGTNVQGDIFMSSSSDFSAHTTGSSVYKLIMQPTRRSDPSSCTKYLKNSTSVYHYKRPAETQRYKTPTEIVTTTKPTTTRRRTAMSKPRIRIRTARPRTRTATTTTAKPRIRTAAKQTSLPEYLQNLLSTLRKATDETQRLNRLPSQRDSVTPRTSKKATTNSPGVVVFKRKPASSTRRASKTKRSKGKKTISRPALPLQLSTVYPLPDYLRVSTELPLFYPRRQETLSTNYNLFQHYYWWR